MPEQAGFGRHPTLPPPNPTLLPTVNIAPARGWPEGATPGVAAGLAVGAFATGLDHPRWLYVLPNGDVLVAETNAPPKPEDGKGIKSWIMKRAGAGVPSANRITLLHDANGDGIAETRTVFLQGLNSPFGMTLVGDDLYVANTDGLVCFAYRTGETQIIEPGAKVIDLPAGPINYYGQHVDARVKPPRPDLVAKAIAPDYALGAHTTPLGFVFYAGDLLPTRFKGGAFIGQHGSWNRQPRSGYKVIFVPFADGYPAGTPEDVLTGFVNAHGDALGRPVGVAIDRVGALLVADDVGNIVWRVTSAVAQ